MEESTVIRNHIIQSFMSLEEAFPLDVHYARTGSMVADAVDNLPETKRRQVLDFRASKPRDLWGWLHRQGVPLPNEALHMLQQAV